MPISGVLMGVAMASMMPMDQGKPGKQDTHAEHNKRTLTLALTPTLTLTLPNPNPNPNPNQGKDAKHNKSAGSVVGEVHLLALTLILTLAQTLTLTLTARGGRRARLVT